MNTRADLGTLEASGLIQLAAVQPELEYLFRHALVQDAAYSSLLKQDRRALHRLAAETLLSLYPERRRELAGVIAMHYELAGDGAAAAEHFAVAGEHAMERFANRESLSFFERAAALISDDDPRIDLRLRTALGMARVGWLFMAPDPFVERLERAIGGAGENADQRLLGDAYFWTAFLRRRRGEQVETSEAMRDALANAARIGEKLGDPVAQAIPKAFMGIGLIFSGHLRQGAEQASEALEVMDGRADTVSTAILSGFLTMAYARLGEFGLAERSLARAHRLAERGDEIARLDALIAESGIELERGDFAGSTALASSCTQKAEELGATACAVASNVMHGAARLQAEDVLGAKPPVERGLELSLVTNMGPMRALAQGMLGTVQGRLGNRTEAVADWDKALAAARAEQDRYGEAVTLWNRGRTSARQKEPDHAAALTDLDAALALFEAMEARPSLARVLRDRAESLRALGRMAEADAGAERSQALATELGLKDFA